MHKGCPEEFPIRLIINKQEVAIFQLTNQDLEDWTYGYLFAEGLIQNACDVLSIEVRQEFFTIYVELNQDIESFLNNKKKHFTAGCGNGVTFFSMTDIKNFKRVEDSATVSRAFLLEKMHEFAKNCPMYLQTGGMHGACLVMPDGKMTIREDIGRHNAVDKVIGHGIRKGYNPSDIIILTSGRISYEMLSKVARFGVGVVGSRTAATKQAVQLAKVLNVEVVGYIRGKMTTVYTDGHKIIDSF